jgi:hypothetical protein
MMCGVLRERRFSFVLTWASHRCGPFARSFGIGGLTDALRRTPPPVGSIITFRCAPACAWRTRAHHQTQFVHSQADASCVSQLQ